MISDDDHPPPETGAPVRPRVADAAPRTQREPRTSSRLTAILEGVSDDSAALDEVVPVIVGRLRRLAQGLLRSCRFPIELQATELVNELYAELCGVDPLPRSGRNLLALSATVMRRIIIRDLRRNLAAKREGRTTAMPLEYAENVARREDLDVTLLLSLDQAVEVLGEKAPRLRSLVELRFFAGLTIAETARALRVSPATVKRMWTLALPMLRDLLAESPVAPRFGRASIPADGAARPIDRDGLSTSLARDSPTDVGSLTFLERPVFYLAEGHEPGGLEGRELGKYLLGPRIAEGGSSEIYRASSTESGDEQEYVVKVLRPDLARVAYVHDMFRRERVSRLLEVPGLVPVVDHGRSSCGRPYLVTPFVHGTSITRFCCERRLGIARRLQHFDRLCWIVSHLHRAEIVHCDLKPDNILLTPTEHVRLLDLGIAQVTWARARSGRSLSAFTRAYASPEQLRGESPTPATDLFALGVILLELLCGDRRLLAATELRALTDEILSSRAMFLERGRRSSFRCHTALAGDLARILQRLLDDSPLRRGGLDQLREDLATAGGPGLTATPRPSR